MGAGELGQEPAIPPSRGRAEPEVSSDDEIREFLLANEDAPPPPRGRRDALHLSAALVAVIVIMVAASVAFVGALPYLIQGGIWLLFAADPCQDGLRGCG